MKNYQLRIFGILFILTFISYGFGSYFVEEILTHSASKVAVSIIKQEAVFASILIGLLHTIFNASLLIIMFRQLYSYDKLISLFYILFGFIATVFLAVGGITLHNINSLEVFNLEDINSYVNINTRLYVFGMIFWGGSGLAFVSLIFKYTLMNNIVCLWGFIGYICLIIGNIWEIVNSDSYGTVLSLSGGLFEIVISLIFIFSNKWLSPKLIAS